jgi:hypothetical protein
MVDGKEYGRSIDMSLFKMADLNQNGNAVKR